MRRAAPREDAALNAAIVSEGTLKILHPAVDPARADPGDLVAALKARILEALEDAKAEDVVALDLSGKTSIGDVMVIASGRSTTHVGAIADRVLKVIKEAGTAAPKVQGMPHNDWVLVDLGDIIVNLFRPEVRSFYNLEKLWGADRPAERRPL